MKISIYDFDKTIYDGDSMVDFYRYCLVKKPALVRYLPHQLFHIFLFKLGLENRTQVKSNFFTFLKSIDDVDQYVADFWARNEYKIKQWYKEKDHASAVIVSASPEFLLRPLLPKLGAQTLMATQLDKHTGHITGQNCYGVEKVARLGKEFSEMEVVEAYSDSLSDMPILEIAERKYIVKGKKILTLEAYRALSKIHRLLLSL